MIEFGWCCGDFCGQSRQRDEADALVFKMVEFSNEGFLLPRAFLKQNINTQQTRKMCVVLHHPPCVMGNQRHMQQTDNFKVAHSVCHNPFPFEDVQCHKQAPFRSSFRGVGFVRPDKPVVFQTIEEVCFAVSLCPFRNAWNE